jgi:hypothetical protein
MQLTSVVFAVSIFTSTATAWFFPFITPAPPAPPTPPVTSTCQAAVSYKPLGSFLFGPLFPNPYAGLGGSLTIPNCNVAPAPVCPSGQSCLNTANPCAAGQVCLSSSNPCTVSGQSCMSPPPPHVFPAAQAAANAACGSGQVGCLNMAGNPVRCCAA